MVSDTYSTEKKLQIRDGLERVIVHSNKVVREWGSTGVVRNRRHLVSYDGLNGLVRVPL